MASVLTIKWKDLKDSSTVVITKNETEYNISIQYQEYDDISNNLSKGYWYGTVIYNDVTKTTKASINRIEAKIKVLKLLSEIENDSN